jgi:hypothetical protein
MDSPTTIRLLAWQNNARGDLFTRLMNDLFFALGYDALRRDVHQSGRELDIQGTHRLEPRRMVAECKAHTDKMGGSELNKFFGALTRERKKSAPVPITGYFVSLSGFTETGISQETETGDDRLILLDAPRVIAELEHSRVLVGYARAAERAGHCAAHARLQDAVLDGADLLGHERGYLWALFYAHGKARTHVALIHADGTPLAESIAQEVIDADRQCGGSLHRLQYLSPPSPTPDRRAFADAAVARYRQWLGEECGYIQLDGLPAATDLSAARLKIERLFVPLKVLVSQQEPEADNIDVLQSEGRVARAQLQPVGVMLSAVRYVALLAAPGSGKSTLLKRLAMAYAFPDRRVEVADDLPARDWLPLFLRCRELRDRAHRPILELLDDLPRYAGMSDHEAGSFREYVHEALRAGRALLLVDGLDEVSEEGARRTFAQHLRTFVSMFPQAAMVVTSREAGFRLVSGVVASVCTPARLAPFNRDDVQRLCEHWHVEVVGDNDKVRTEARELAKTIWGNGRIRTLAENPLLLTTLLVVKRWIGELPRSRAALYREAIHVLIRTWNVEGYVAMEEEETLAHLSYVACAMMEQGIQQVGRKGLLKLLQSARQELEAELQFARLSAMEFIERIEYRSSLLIQTGHDVIDGELQPVYEFRHLTFQEFLTARGYVEEQYPGRDAGHSLVDLLEPHFTDERWREVIPLAAVLAGRKAEVIIERLIRVCTGLQSKFDLNFQPIREPHVILLRQCLLDEVHVTAPTLHAALQQMARHGYESLTPGSVLPLRRGKFGMLFQEIAEAAFLGGDDGWEQYIETMQSLAVEVMFQDQEPSMSEEVADSLMYMLTNGDRVEKIRAALVCMELAFLARDEISMLTKARFQLLSTPLSAMLDPDDLPMAMAVCWALAWIGSRRLTISPPEASLLRSLYWLWQKTTPRLRELAFMPTWAFAKQRLLPRNTFSNDAWGDCDPWLRQAEDTRLRQTEHDNDHAYYAALIVAWYRRAPWNDTELAEKLRKVGRSSSFHTTARSMLETLGGPGQLVLEEWDHEPWVGVHKGT